MESFFSSYNQAITSKNSRDDEMVHEFIEQCGRVRNNDPSVTYLVIGHQADQAKTSALCDALEQNTMVKRIRIDFQNEFVVSRPLLEYLQYSPKLSIMELFNVDFNNAGVCTTLLLLLKGIARNPAVRELSVEASNNADSKSIFGLVSTILQGAQKDCLLLHSGVAASFRQLKYVEYLWLEHIDDVILCQILPSLRHLNNLKTLTLVPSPYEQSDTTFDTVGALLTASTSLEQIELHDCILTYERMNTIARGLWNSASVTEFGLHTSRLDAGATDQLRALYCRRPSKQRGSKISGLTIGRGVQLNVPLVVFLRSIMSSSKSTLKCLDLKSRGTCSDDILLYLAGRKEDELRMSTMFRAGWKSLTGTDYEDIIEELKPQLTELKWGTIESEETLTLFEDVVANMTSLVQVTVDVHESLDPVDILSLSKTGNIEMCRINGQTYDIRKSSKSDATKRRKREKKPVVDLSDNEEKSFDGSFDGIGLELSEAQQIDEFCDQESSSAEEFTSSSAKSGDISSSEESSESGDTAILYAENRRKNLVQACNKASENIPTGGDATVNTFQQAETDSEAENPVDRSVESSDKFVSDEQTKELSECQDMLTVCQTKLGIGLSDAPVRRAPSHIRSDTATILQMRSRIVDIRKCGIHRKDPFYYESRLQLGDQNQGKGAPNRPARSSSDTHILYQMQDHHARASRARNGPQKREDALLEQDDDSSTVSGDQFSDQNMVLDAVVEPSHARKEEMMKEIREDFAGLELLGQLYSQPSEHTILSDQGSGYDLEDSEELCKESCNEPSSDDTNLNSSLLSSFHTADEGVVHMEVVELPDYIVDTNCHQQLPAKDNASIDSFYTAHRLHGMKETDPADQDSPASFASPRNHLATKISLIENASFPDDNSSSSELIDFDMELRKVMN